ncbi:M56 family metallopeptidase [Flagellimonas eckloniae]|uniref:M56 family metallopeptidase n=1 Tax=Flagellimonas eckloniae TaxID=346185 RepID=UPI0006DCD71D|nr:M56 family metallopeptidase [Allomuricauda eckloniae]
MLEYLLKTFACLAVFLVFYRLLLEKESIHKFKRFYLLGGIIVSFIIPSLVFVEYVEPALTSNTIFPVSYEEYSPIINEQPKDINTLNWSLILWSVYGLGIVGFGFRFFRHLFQILKRIKNNPKIKQNFITKVLLREKMPPHTFFSFIFLNKRNFESNTIPKEILTHEETHARQYHSVDVLFIELLQVVFWFNPLIYLFKKSIKLNHEFLADRAVIEEERDTVNYQNTLLSYLSHESLKKYQSTGMSNSINYSSIKKRFTIMKKRTSKKAVLLRTLLLFPVCALLLYGFSEIKYVEKDSSSPPNSNQNPTLPSEIIKSGDENTKEMFSRTNFTAQDTPAIEEDNGDIAGGVSTKKNFQINATRAQMAEYNSIAKKYNEMLSKQGDFHIEGADIERLKYLHGLMSDKQRANAEPFPNFPEPPSAPEPPKEVSPDTPQSPGLRFSIAEAAYTNATSLDTLIASAPKPETKNQSQWVVSSGINPNSRGNDYATLPPPAPAIAKHVNTDNYSSELNSALNQYLNSVLAYEQNVQAYRKDEKGSLKSLHVEFDKIMELYTNYYELAHKEDKFIQPQVPPAPQSPLDHVIDMAKNGATFYFEGKEISSDRAIELLKKNKELNIETTGHNSKNPKVKISKSPIRVKKSSGSKINLETGNITVNGNELFYSTKNDITSYFNTKGEQVDRQGKKLEGQSTKNPTFYYNGNKISSVKAYQLLKNNRSIQVTTEDYTEDEYAVVLTDLSKVSYNKNPNKNKNPNSFIDLTEMIEKEASFFYNDKPISTERALWLTQNTEIERVNTKSSKNGKPKVYFWKKN